MLLTPNGAGSSTQFARWYRHGANYSQTNELPPSIAQYVSSATVAQRDMYTLSDIGVAVQSINCVEGIFLARTRRRGGSLADDQVGRHALHDQRGHGDRPEHQRWLRAPAMGSRSQHERGVDGCICQSSGAEGYR